MYRSLIVAKIMPGREHDVAQIFAESDRTELPRVAGISHRSLYSLGDLYVHVIESPEPGPSVLATARQHPEFARISERLRPFISPYLSTWRSPQDAVATCFYRWDADGAADAGGGVR